VETISLGLMMPWNRQASTQHTPATLRQRNQAGRSCKGSNDGVGRIWKKGVAFFR